jgi:hypothetical protein
MAGDLALPDNSWLESQADISAILQQPPPPVVDVGNSDAPIHFSEAGLAADVSSSLAAQRSSPETSINDRENHDRASGADAKSAPVDSRIATPPIEPKEEAALREYIERFIENFNEQSARTRALLSPAADGGPPGTN